jgi:transposase-like protein
MPHTATRFTPSFCPNPRCDSRTNPTTWRFQRKGFYPRRRPPHRVQRYRCSHCRRCFSSQTFSTTYWLKRPDLLEPVFHRLIACSALRQIAREHQVSHSTIRTLSDRLGRHCLLFHEQLRPRTCPTEPLVLDGFRSFEHSQYWPLDLNLVVGPSLFVYGFNDVELRRSGTMRPAQRLKRDLLERRFGRPDPEATRKRVEELLRRVIPSGGMVELRSDEHPAYPRAIGRLRDHRTILHDRTSAKEARTPRNPLFPVNLSDLLIRHSSANHKRETIAFSKRRQSALYRLAVWAVWRNYVKGRSENRKLGPPAMALGLIGRALSVKAILARRLFPERVFPRSAWLWACYFGRIPTRAIERCARHRARYAM